MPLLFRDTESGRDCLRGSSAYPEDGSPESTSISTPGFSKRTSGGLQAEALVLTYNNLLLLLGALFVFGLMLLPLVRRPRSFFAH